MHFWGRTFASMGYYVRLITAQYVKDFIHSQSSDALAIRETALRLSIHLVSIFFAFNTALAFLLRSVVHRNFVL